MGSEMCIRDSRINRADNAMGVAASNHDRIGLVWSADIVGVATLSANERRVFAPPNGLSDAEFGQRKGSFGGAVIH